ncbi:transglycosylase SLT domain-containing protein [Nitrincola tapanii]|uniref:LysM peptidoglycan-binding domain-containing protein n=1 Tax=Nitrincola tapanii TaxID=1708751 RepID=A0A5A9W5E6_9GAMM|nr:transglycosylase SLT domain-containing protein [Nitrincola tapanii]KAA0875299.1 LysM peptidoglycan-binding domain-containing protein [Nitrincola tapanii]
MTKQRLSTLALTCALVLSGCSSAPQQTHTQLHQHDRLDKHSALLIQARMARFAHLQQQSEEDEISDLWSLTRTHLGLELDLNDLRIEQHFAWLAKHPQHLTNVSEQALPYYYYVLDQVIERGMPAEVALLPVIESGYNPYALSPSNAAGPWQFIPGTAKHFGLENNWWYDARRDIVASTDAALTYLSQLNEQFGGDWLLTLAAYNAGGGTVSRAIEYNQARNLPIDFWSLNLPQQTMNYVPKLLATARMIRDAEDYGLELADIPAEPYFAEVETGGQVDLKQAAELAEIDLDELKQLNPGFSRWATAPEGPHRLLVPVEQAEQLQQALESLPDEERVNFASYTIKSGDTLGALARRFNTTVQVLQTTNRIQPHQLRVGQTLLVPAASDRIALKPSGSGPG